MLSYQSANADIFKIIRSEITTIIIDYYDESIQLNSTIHSAITRFCYIKHHTL